MTESRAHSEENARRIHALVRAAYSPVVWALAVLSGAALVLDSLGSGSNRSTVSFFFIVLISLFNFYLAVGGYEAFAHSKSTVSIPQALQAAGKVLGRFLWMIVQAAFFLFVASLVISLVFLALSGPAALQHAQQSGGEPSQAIRLLYGGVAALFVVLTVYWFPIVFVHGDFRLFPTLNAAVRTLGRHYASLGYLAILLLLPAAILLLGAEAVPFPVVAIVAMAGEVLRWAAFAYCVDVVAGEPAPAKPA
jgi:hypothetical protein